MTTTFPTNMIVMYSFYSLRFDTIHCEVLLTSDAKVGVTSMMLSTCHKYLQ
jgi:hypothetical protein